MIEQLLTLKGHAVTAMSRSNYVGELKKTKIILN